MLSPSRTTFEVRVCNKLQRLSIWVKIAAELNYAKELQSSSQQNNHNQYSTSNANSNYINQERDESKYSNNKTHDKSTYNSASSSSSSYASSQSSSNSSSGRGGGGISFLRFEAGGGGSSSKLSSSSSNATGSSSNSSSLSTSSDKLRHTINANSLSTVDENASSASNSDAAMTISSTKNTNNATLTNKTIEPGFVRITPLQSLAIPVIVESEAQVVYITIYCLDKQGERIVIANQLQMNRELVIIRRNKITNDIEIAHGFESEFGQTGKTNDFRTILLDWGLPEYLCDAMKHCGWHNTKLWDNITDQHLVKMGFKDGHREVFHYEYSKWKTTTQRIKKKLTYKDLLSKWGIPIHLYGNMKENGWDNIYLWHKLSDKDLEDMGFKRGHIEIFRLHVNEKGKEKMQMYMKEQKDHFEEFAAMQRDLEQNKTNTIINYEDDEDEHGQHGDEELKSQYDIPRVPGIIIKKEQVYHNAFDLDLAKIQKNEIYIIEIKQENKDWKIKAQITQTKQQRIDGLIMNTSYLVRARAQNAFKKKSEYSDIIKIKTKGKKWRHNNVPSMPSFEYGINGSYNKLSKFIIEFKESGIKQIKETQYKQKYLYTN